MSLGPIGNPLTRWHCFRKCAIALFMAGASSLIPSPLAPMSRMFTTNELAWGPEPFPWSSVREEASAIVGVCSFRKVIDVLFSVLLVESARRWITLKISLTAAFGHLVLVFLLGGLEQKKNLCTLASPLRTCSRRSSMVMQEYFK